MREIYSFIFYLVTPLLLLKLWRRGKLSPAYRQRIKERFGYASVTTTSPPLWVHAVSVGETVAIAPVLKRLLAQQPELAILITTSTPTGADRVATLFADLPQVIHQYCPYDQPLAVNKFLQTHTPIGLLIVETELWPNMLAQCKRRNIAVLLANGRMSEKSAAGYRKLAPMTRVMMQQIDVLVAQYPTDGERFKALGLASEKLVVSGSIKFDLQLAENTLAEAKVLRQTIGVRPVIILGSSHRTEEQGVFELLPELWRQCPTLMLMVVPRHPERFTEVYELAKQYSTQVVRRSKANVSDTCQIYLGDTMGELAVMYAAADLAIVGGSFVALGGQSPIEPAAVGKGVLMGPEQFNFSVICPELEAAGGLHTCKDFSALQEQLTRLLAEPEKVKEMGVKAEHYYLSQRGASDILLAKIRQVLLVK